MGGIALELLVEQVKCYVSTNHLLGRHFFYVEEVNLISCTFKKCMVSIRLGPDSPASNR